MIRIKTISFPRIKYEPSPVFQVYDLTSKDLKTEDYIHSLDIELHNFLSKMFKEPKYQIMVIIDENINKFNIIKTIIKLTDEEYEFYKNVPFYHSFENAEGGLGELLDYYSDDVAYTKEKEQSQLWCDVIKKYLSNLYKFYGDIKLKIAFNNGKLEFANFTATGKGTDDTIILLLKRLSEYIRNNLFYKTEDEIFIIINTSLEKLNNNGENNNE